MSCCHSGDGGAGTRFKNTFIDQAGANYFCFQGYKGSINPDSYEKREFYHLAKGHTIENAHKKAKTETNPSFKTVFTYKGACYNAIRLAPLIVDTERQPPGAVVPGQPFIVKVKVTNKEYAPKRVNDVIVVKDETVDVGRIGITEGGSISGVCQDAAGRP